MTATATILALVPLAVQTRRTIIRRDRAERHTMGMYNDDGEGVVSMAEIQEPAGIAERIDRIETGLFVEPPLWSEDGRRATLAERLAFHNTPGLSVAVINEGKVEWARGYGVVEAGRDDPVTADTIFQACSISKHVAMIGALRLVQDGVLDLDEDANRYLTSWRAPANGAWQPRVTVRQLLGHTAGLTYCWYRGFRHGDATPTLPQVLDGVGPANTPPVRVVLLPGTQFRYSGSHYSVLQQLMVDATGTPFPMLMRALVLDPLGMRNSSYDQSYPDTRPATTAVGHYLGGAPVDGQWRVIPEMAGAGLWTTPGDLARLACAIQHAHTKAATGFLTPDLVDQALTPQIDASFGLGTQLEGPDTVRRFGHGGDNIGYKCFTTAYLEHGLGAVVMTNADDGAWVALEVLRRIADEYGWPDYTPARAATSVDARAYDGYAGTYALRPGVTIGIERKGDTLLLTLQGQPAIELRPSSDTTFLSPAVNSAITFTIGEDGRATGLSLQQEDHEIQAQRLR